MAYEDEGPYKPRIRGPKEAIRVDSVLGSSFAHLGLAAKLREYNIKKAWHECVGENISRRAAPSRLIGTTLHCSVSSSPWMSELNYQKQVIISKLNKLLGEGAVKDIVFRIGPVKPFSTHARTTPARPRRELTPEDRKFIEETTSVIKDEKLRKAVQRAMAKAKG